MSRSVWSHWTVLLLALLAGFTSPALAVAHGVAHAHGAESHRAPSHDEAPAHGQRHAHEHEHEETHELASADEHEHEPELPAARAHHDNRATVGDQDHGHRHDHARLEPATTGKPDTRIVAETPVHVAASPAVLPQATHERLGLTRWDIVALARPAPDTGPPPALRAPPIR